MNQQHITSFIKGISWRFVATFDTIFLSYIYTGSIGNSLTIGIVEVFTKIFLFYLHERVWLKIKWQTKTITSSNGENILTEQKIRSAIKGISWRIFGTLDTILIATLITNDFSQALKIGSTEFITKIILYYFHERIWLYFTKKRLQS